MSFITAILGFLAPFKAIIGYVFMGLTVVWGLYAKGKRDAKREMESRATKQAYKDSKTRAKIEDELVNLNDDNDGSLLSSWTRDGNNN